MIGASIIVVPSLLGYIGASRHSKVILFLVCIKSFVLKQLNKSFYSTLFSVPRPINYSVDMWVGSFDHFPGSKIICKESNWGHSSFKSVNLQVTFYRVFLKMSPSIVRIVWKMWTCFGTACIFRNIINVLYLIVQRKFRGAPSGKSDLGPHYGSVAVLWCQIFLGLHEHYPMDEY